MGLASLAVAVAVIGYVRARTYPQRSKERAERRENNQKKRESESIDDVNRAEHSKSKTGEQLNEITRIRPVNLEKELNEINTNIENVQSEIKLLNDRKLDLRAIIEPEIKRGEIKENDDGSLKVKYTHGAEDVEIEVSNRYLKRVQEALKKIDDSVQKSEAKVEKLRKVKTDIKRNIEIPPEKHLEEIADNPIIVQHLPPDQSLNEKKSSPISQDGQEDSRAVKNIDGPANPFEGYNRREQIEHGVSRISGQADPRYNLGSHRGRSQG